MGTLYLQGRNQKKVGYMSNLDTCVLPSLVAKGDMSSILGNVAYTHWCIACCILTTCALGSSGPNPCVRCCGRLHQCSVVLAAGAGLRASWSGLAQGVCSS